MSSDPDSDEEGARNLLACLCRPELEEKLGSILCRRASPRSVSARVSPGAGAANRSGDTPTARSDCVTRIGGLQPPGPESDDLSERARAAGVPVWEVEQAAHGGASVDRSVPPSRPPSSECLPTVPDGPPYCLAGRPTLIGARCIAGSTTLAQMVLLPRPMRVSRTGISRGHV
jgi:hypothetical protein